MKQVKQQLLRSIPEGKWISGKALQKVSGVMQFPFSHVSRLLQEMTHTGEIKHFSWSKGSFYALPDAPDVTAEMERRKVFMAFPKEGGRSLKRICELAGGTSPDRVKEIVDQWLFDGTVETFINREKKELLRLVYAPEFPLLVETIAPPSVSWERMNALFVAMARQTTVRNVYEYAR